MTIHLPTPGVDEVVRWTADRLTSLWPDLAAGERARAFRRLGGGEDDDFFLALPTHEQADLLDHLPAEERRLWVRLLPPDDAADLVQQVDDEDRQAVLDLMDAPTRREVQALLAYAEDEAGGLMSPRFARLRPEATADEALAYLRRQARADAELVAYAYVLDRDQRLLGVLSLRELLAAPGDRVVRELMTPDVISVGPDTAQEVVARLMRHQGLLAVPVIDGAGTLVGIVTIDDVLDVVAEAATEDAHLQGGLAALELPYLDTSLVEMVQKRAGWLALLFLGSLGTASLIDLYQAELARVVVLASFVPMVIASGGNAGTQAAALVIRAMALGEVRPRDALRVVRREAVSGLALGVLLAVLGAVRILGWEGMFGTYGELALPVALVVSASLLAVVLWGALVGAVLPLAVRAAGLDPATASTPLVATICDVSGLALYFALASAVL